jgi:hypothetical protein
MTLHAQTVSDLRRRIAALPELTARDEILTLIDTLELTETVSGDDQAKEIERLQAERQQFVESGDKLFAECRRLSVAQTSLCEQVRALREALDEMLNYTGGAYNALEDQYVMARVNAALAATEPPQ